MGLPILQENRWSFPVNKLDVEIGTETVQFCFLGTHKWDFRCSAGESGIRKAADETVLNKVLKIALKYSPVVLFVV
jgi:hypothetical protein